MQPVPDDLHDAALRAAKPNPHLSVRRWCLGVCIVLVVSGSAASSASELPALGAATNLSVEGSGYAIFDLAQGGVLHTQQWDIDGMGLPWLQPIDGYLSRFDVNIRTTADVAALVIQDVDGPSDFEYTFLQINRGVEGCRRDPCPGLEMDRPVYSTRLPRDVGEERLWDLSPGRYAVGLVTHPPAHATATLRLEIEDGEAGELSVVLDRPTDAYLRGSTEVSPLGLPSSGGFASGQSWAASFGFAYLYWSHDGSISTSPLEDSVELCTTIGCSRRTEILSGGGGSWKTITLRLFGEEPWMSWRIDALARDRQLAAGLFSWPSVRLS